MRRDGEKRAMSALIGSTLSLAPLTRWRLGKIFQFRLFVFGPFTRGDCHTREQAPICINWKIRTKILLCVTLPITFR